MKTTIELPDDLFMKVKMLAAQQRTTLKDLTIQALRLLTQTPPENMEKERKANIKRLLKTMQATNTTPMVPLKREEIYER